MIKWTEKPVKVSEKLRALQSLRLEPSPEFHFDHVTVISNFAFAKMIMVNELKEASAAMLQNQFIAAVAGDGQARAEMTSGQVGIDPHLIVEADSSRQSAIDGLPAQPATVPPSVPYHTSILSANTRPLTSSPISWLLKRTGGTTIEEIMAAMGWQKHTAQALSYEEPRTGDHERKGQRHPARLDQACGATARSSCARTSRACADTGSASGSGPRGPNPISRLARSSANWKR